MGKKKEETKWDKERKRQMRELGSIKGKGWMPGGKTK